MRPYLLAIILILFLFAGCTGVSQEEFDRLNQTTVQQQSQITVLESQVATLQSEKNNLSTQVSTLQTQVAELSRLNKTAIKSKIEIAKAEIDFYVWLGENVFTDTPKISGSAALFETIRKLNSIDNPVLTEEWDRFIECSSEREDCSPETLMSTLLSEAQKDIDSALSEVK